jgi:hypothetical protein
MSIITEQDITAIPLLVDRSPELRRGAIPDNHERSTPANHAEMYIIDDDVIATARRGDGVACAIALVIKRKHPDWDVNISGERPIIGGQPVPLTESLVDWIGRFDRHEPVEPTYFWLSWA